MSTTLETQLLAFANAVGTDVGTLIKEIGNPANLTTTNKTNLVNAINSLQAALAAISGSVINDASVGDTTTTYSSSKINTLLTTLKSDIIDGAPAALDTLKEIATQLANDESAASALTLAVSNKVDYSTAQSLTTAQQQQACANIGIGNPFSDLATAYTTAKTTAST